MAVRKLHDPGPGWTLQCSWKDSHSTVQLSGRRFKTREEAEAYKQQLQPYPDQRVYNVVEVGKDGEIL